MPKGAELGEGVVLVWGIGASGVNIMGVQVNWGEAKKKVEGWCYCGLPATQIINGIKFCRRHKELKKEVQRIGRYGGASKSVNRYNDYK
jgi:hypothetical protein